MLLAHWNKTSAAVITTHFSGSGGATDLVCVCVCVCQDNNKK